MKVINRKAKFNYDFLEEFETGIILTGAEVKSVKKAQISLNEAFVKIDVNGEVWLVNSHIHPYKFADNRNYDPTRSRKLLLHKKEILSLLKKMEGRNLTLIPVLCYTFRGKVKLKIALARGKKQWEKREKIKKKDLEREMARSIKGMT